VPGRGLEAIELKAARNDHSYDRSPDRRNVLGAGGMEGYDGQDGRQPTSQEK
jgi:hypothetical protein